MLVSLGAPNGPAPERPEPERPEPERPEPARLVPEQLLGDLTPSQHLAVTTSSATVCVLASAGAGKTRVLTRRVGYRIACGTAKAEHVVAITFTRKAADELRQRLSDIGLPTPVTAGTFHSLAFSQLRRWWADRRTPEPALLKRKGRLLAELVVGRPGLQDVDIGQLASLVEWAKARHVQPDDFVAAVADAHRELPADGAAVAALYGRYEDEKRRRRLVDFDDLLGRYAGALETDGRFAAAQRWRWRHLFVDELQDVNPLQSRLLLALLGQNDDVFVVGDPNQAIYGWNGADPAFLASIPERWPGAEVVRLEENHRSTPQVVAAACSALGRHAAAVRSTRPDGPLPRLRSYPSEDAEARSIAAQLLEAHARGLRWAGMAVLTRTNSQAAVISQAFLGGVIPFRAATTGDGVGVVEEEERAPSPGSQPEDAVTVCTFHRAKGLQWPAVWVCGLEAGFVPIAYASGVEAVAEERRLLYVALTRAERELHCSWARERRTSSGKALRREPSPWLTALASHCDVDSGGRCWTEAPTDEDRHPEPAPAGASSATLASLASARRRLDFARTGPARAATLEPDAVTSAVAEQLQEWRRRMARASGVPPHVLLHDSTLRAIAARRPADAAELLAVPGIGPVKVARFGPAVLDVVRAAMEPIPETAVGA
jgi:superfamily I DNA/RNA helicase